MQVYETTPDDFLRLIGSQDSAPMHTLDVAVARMQGLPYRANEEDIVREGRGEEGVWVWGVREGRGEEEDVRSEGRGGGGGWCDVWVVAK